MTQQTFDIEETAHRIAHRAMAGMVNPATRRLPISPEEARIMVQSIYDDLNRDYISTGVFGLAVGGVSQTVHDQLEHLNMLAALRATLKSPELIKGYVEQVPAEVYGVQFEVKKTTEGGNE